MRESGISSNGHRPAVRKPLFPRSRHPALTRARARSASRLGPARRSMPGVRPLARHAAQTERAYPWRLTRPPAGSPLLRPLAGRLRVETPVRPLKGRARIPGLRQEYAESGQVSLGECAALPRTHVNATRVSRWPDREWLAEWRAAPGGRLPPIRRGSQPTREKQSVACAHARDGHVSVWVMSSSVVCCRAEIAPFMS